MQDPTQPRQSKLARAKKFLKDNEGPIAFGAGCFIGSAIVVSFPKAFIPREALYNPMQPIPGVNLTEGAILRNSAAGWMAVDFLTEKGLIDEFINFSGEVTKAALNVAKNKE